MTPLNGTSSWAESARPLNGHSSDANRLRLITEQHGEDAQPVATSVMPSAAWPAQEVDDVDQERVRLELEIAAAKVRAAAARNRAEAREEALRVALHAELLSSNASLTEMESGYEATIALVRDAARGEVDRILADARRRVSGISSSGPSTAPSPSTASVAEQEPGHDDE